MSMPSLPRFVTDADDKNWLHQEYNNWIDVAAGEDPRLKGQPYDYDDPGFIALINLQEARVPLAPSIIYQKEPSKYQSWGQWYYQGLLLAIREGRVSLNTDRIRTYIDCGVYFRSQAQRDLLEGEGHVWPSDRPVNPAVNRIGYDHKLFASNPRVNPEPEPTPKRDSTRAMARIEFTTTPETGWGRDPTVQYTLANNRQLWDTKDTNMDAPSAEDITTFEQKKDFPDWMRVFLFAHVSEENLTDESWNPIPYRLLDDTTMLIAMILCTNHSLRGQLWPWNFDKGGAPRTTREKHGWAAIAVEGSPVATEDGQTRWNVKTFSWFVWERYFVLGGSDLPRTTVNTRQGGRDAERKKSRSEPSRLSYGMEVVEKSLGKRKSTDEQPFLKVYFGRDGTVASTHPGRYLDVLQKHAPVNLAEATEVEQPSKRASKRISSPNAKEAEQPSSTPVQPSTVTPSQQTTHTPSERGSHRGGSRGGASSARGGQPGTPRGGSGSHYPRRRKADPLVLDAPSEDDIDDSDDDSPPPPSAKRPAPANSGETSTPKRPRLAGTSSTIVSQAAVKSTSPSKPAGQEKPQADETLEEMILRDQPRGTAKIMEDTSTRNRRLVSYFKNWNAHHPAERDGPSLGKYTPAMANALRKVTLTPWGKATGEPSSPVVRQQATYREKANEEVAALNADIERLNELTTEYDQIVRSVKQRSLTMLTSRVYHQPLHNYLYTACQVVEHLREHGEYQHSRKLAQGVAGVLENVPDVAAVPNVEETPGLDTILNGFRAGAFPLALPTMTPTERAPGGSVIDLGEESVEDADDGDDFVGY
ncbi:hypothetical protein LTR70_003317 [Exophiala xenobiotica]|uniref:Uncharacterized protein n=1 Tax=Lithohypha guttulata TaxID=1690604 RepID=A0ABR0KLY6_9EURO|nr:hypothetical protein LTR24_001190 [Lithohypha guttulata]KAK5323639.1 hypothetical protein LTR70_003317 [Exophiala xenobiotica]